MQRNGREDEIENELLELTEYEYEMETDDPKKSQRRARETSFLLAQFYYDLEKYDKAWTWYSKVQTFDLRGTLDDACFLSLRSKSVAALYQMAVMSFEGVGPKDFTPVR